MNGPILQIIANVTAIKQDTLKQQLGQRPRIRLKCNLIRSEAKEEHLEMCTTSRYRTPAGVESSSHLRPCHQLILTLLIFSSAMAIAATQQQRHNYKSDAADNDQANRVPTLRRFQRAPQSQIAVWPFASATDRATSSSSGVAHFGFPSARLVYPQSPARSGDTAKPTATTTNSSQRVQLIHEHLNTLKRQLEAELRVNQRDKVVDVVLGSPCFSSTDCAQSIKNSHCNTANFTCSCLNEHIPLNPSTCLAPKLLGYECQLDAQCQQKVPASVCQAGKCACPPGNFVPYKKNKCLAPSNINDYCLTDGQCQLNDRHSFCKWMIANIYGTCKCPPNYKLISTLEEHELKSSNGTAQQRRENKQRAGGEARLRCAPRLGDSCLNTDECLLTTANSICSGPSPGTTSTLKLVTQLKSWAFGGSSSSSSSSSSWPTSSASDSRCTCAPGYVWSSNQLECKADETIEQDRSSSSLVHDTHKYEMIVIPTAAATTTADSLPAQQETTIEVTTSSSRPVIEQLDIKLLNTTNQSQNVLAHRSPSISSSSSSTSTTTQKPTKNTNNQVFANATITSTSATRLTPPAVVRMSSLGKSCSTSQECQARDPYSDCVGGICECQMPTTRCRASSTGCHRDTFQCRNGQCISWYFVCDSFRNCDDGSDEDDCKPGRCPAESFQCGGHNGACITRGKICNGKRDCLDGSDELNCGSLVVLDGHHHHQHQHHSSGKTNLIIGNSDTNATATNPSLVSSVSGQSLSHYYNATSGNNDTIDNLHSIAIKQTNTNALNHQKCHPNSFTCYDGQCLPAYVFCNAVQDCRDGSDEDELVCERPAARRKWLEAINAPPSGPKTSSTPSVDFPPLDLLRLNASATIETTNKRPLNSSSMSSSSTPPPADGDESPLVKTDRASIQRLVAALVLSNRTPENRGRRQKATATTTTQTSVSRGRRHSKLLKENAEPNRVAPPPPDECPRWAFTCTNGKCRSSAILCSGVDGCGDNSDEDHCEVCQCEPPTTTTTTTTTRLPLAA